MLNSYACPTTTPNSLQLHYLWKRLWNTHKSMMELNNNDDDEAAAPHLTPLPVLSPPHPTTMLLRRQRRTKMMPSNLPICKEEDEEGKENGYNTVDQKSHMLKVPPFSPTYSRPNHFPYSNFYIKLPDGRWMVRFRDGNRSILGTDVIQGGLI